MPGRERRDRAWIREDGPVIRSGEDHGQAGAQRPIDDDRARVDAPLPERLHHESAEQILADDRDERRPQAEPGGSARHDRAGSADRQLGVIDEAFRLTERRLELGIGEHEVRVAVTEDDEVERGRH